MYIKKKLSFQFFDYLKKKLKMTHIFLAYTSDKETFDKLDEYTSKENKFLNFEYSREIIPNNLLHKIEFLVSSYKFKDCKDYIKKSIDTTKFQEILYDGSINDLHTIYINGEKVYWILRVPINTPITSFLPIKKMEVKKDTYLIFMNNILMGVANSKIQIFSLIENLCGVEFSEEYFTINFNETKEINHNKNIFKIIKV